MKSKAYLTCSRSVVKKRNNNIDNKGPFNDPRSIALRGFAFCVVGLSDQQLPILPTSDHFLLAKLSD